VGDDAEWEYLMSVQAEASISLLNVLQDRPGPRIFTAAYSALRAADKAHESRTLIFQCNWQIVISGIKRAVRIGGRIFRIFEGSKFDTALDDARILRDHRNVHTFREKTHRS